MSEKRDGQRWKILKLLHQRGSQGATNVELNCIGYRYGARLLELRREWEIETIRESESIFRFVLHGKREGVSGLV